jgi:hypothetical protein
LLKRDTQSDINFLWNMFILNYWYNDLLMNSHTYLYLLSSIVNKADTCMRTAITPHENTQTHYNFGKRRKLQESAVHCNNV